MEIKTPLKSLPTVTELKQAFSFKPVLTCAEAFPRVTKN